MFTVISGFLHSNSTHHKLVSIYNLFDRQNIHSNFRVETDNSENCDRQEKHKGEDQRTGAMTSHLNGNIAKTPSRDVVVGLGYNKRGNSLCLK